MNTAVLTKPLPELRPFTESVECSRFVLLDECPGNTASWFLARCFDLPARPGECAVSSRSPTRCRGGPPPDSWSCPGTSGRSMRRRTPCTPAVRPPAP
ncbi:hypothetical protein LV779_21940 [Streptomyces thinghirensis]|nr:hypothetical protein [Streptomyces thinghirensis]